MATEFEKHITKAHRQTFFKTGNFHGMLNGRSLFTNSVAVIGLGIGAKFFYDTYLQPNYENLWKPGTIKFWNCMCTSNNNNKSFFFPER